MGLRAVHPEAPRCSSYAASAWTSATATSTPSPVKDTCFDYRTNGFAKNEGMRIDLALATPTLLRRCRTAPYADTPRRWPIPSDHIPLVVSFAP